jgi:hypothetical protein
MWEKFGRTLLKQAINALKVLISKLETMQTNKKIFRYQDKSLIEMRNSVHTRI